MIRVFLLDDHEVVRRGLTDLLHAAAAYGLLLLLAAAMLWIGAYIGMLARTVTIKVRFADFTTITRSRTLDVPTDVGQELYDTARALFDAFVTEAVSFRSAGVEGVSPRWPRRDDQPSRSVGAADEVSVRPASVCSSGRRHERPRPRP